MTKFPDLKTTGWRHVVDGAAPATRERMAEYVLKQKCFCSDCRDMLHYLLMLNRWDAKNAKEQVRGGTKAPTDR